MSEKQYQKVTRLAREKHLDLGRCPTCRQRKEEVAPGIWEWPTSTYQLDGEDHDCDCDAQDTLRRHYLLAGIPVDYWTLSEDDFFGDPKALQAVTDYLKGWEDWRWHGIGLAFHSETQGTGKTMLAAIIAKHLIRQGERVLFASFYDTLIPHDMPYEKREDKMNELRHTPVLIIDEIPKPWSDPQWAYFSTHLEDLIRNRTSGNGVTIITTNLTPEQLDGEYPRTFSLLAAKQRHIELNGHDVRRAGEIDLLRMELIANGEAKPIV